MRYLILCLTMLLASPALAGSFTAEPGQGGAVASLQPGTSAFYQPTGKIKPVETGTIKSGTVGPPACAAGKTCFTSASHGFANGDVVIIEGIGGMTELEGVTAVVESAATNTFILPVTTTNDWTSGGTIRKRLWAPLGLGRCSVYSITFASNIADAADVDAVAYPWRCPTATSNSLPPDDLYCDYLNFGGLTYLTGDVGLNFIADDVSPQKLVADLNVPDAQVPRVQVDCR